MMTPRVLAPHILRTLASAQRRGRPVTLQDLVDTLKVRRVDVRAAVSELDRQGLLNALTLRLTLEGFAVGTALRAHKLAAVPRPKTLKAADQPKRTSTAAA
jgi:Mn-dependent DtxR family transcriptional regulator